MESSKLQPPKEYSCKHCNVKTTSSMDLYEHVMGNKHKACLQHTDPSMVPEVQGLQHFLDTYVSDEPILGLEYIVEVQVGDYSYTCQLCGLKADRKQMVGHITGPFHLKIYLDSHYPTVAAYVNELSNKASKFKALQSSAHKIHCLYGRKKIKETDADAECPEPAKVASISFNDFFSVKLDRTHEKSGQPSEKSDLAGERRDPVDRLDLPSKRRDPSSERREYPSKRREYPSRRRDPPSERRDPPSERRDPPSERRDRPRQKSDGTRGEAVTLEPRHIDVRRETDPSQHTTLEAPSEHPERDGILRNEEWMQMKILQFKDNVQFFDYLRDYQIHNDEDATFLKTIINNFTVAITTFQKNQSEVLQRPASSSHPAPAYTRRANEERHSHCPESLDESVPSSAQQCADSSNLELAPAKYSNATEIFFSSIKNMEASEVGKALEKIAATNPAFKGIDIPGVIRYLQQTGRLKNP